MDRLQNLIRIMRTNQQASSGNDTEDWKKLLALMGIKPETKTGQIGYPDLFGSQSFSDPTKPGTYTSSKGEVFTVGRRIPGTEESKGFLDKFKGYLAGKEIEDMPSILASLQGTPFTGMVEARQRQLLKEESEEKKAEETAYNIILEKIKAGRQPSKIEKGILSKVLPEGYIPEIVKPLNDLLTEFITADSNLKNAGVKDINKRVRLIIENIPENEKPAMMKIITGIYGDKLKLDIEDKMPVEEEKNLPENWEYYNKTPLSSIMSSFLSRVGTPISEERLMKMLMPGNWIGQGY